MGISNHMFFFLTLYLSFQKYSPLLFNKKDNFFEIILILHHALMFLTMLSVDLVAKLVTLKTSAFAKKKKKIK